MLTLEQMRRARGELDDLDAALDRPHRVEEHLAVLFRDQPGDLFLVLLQ